MYLLILAILIATIIFIKGMKIINYFDHVAGIMEMIPGPTPYPFVGNLFQFGLKPDEYPKKILQYCRKYNFQGFRSLVLLQYHVMLSDPAEIKNILSSSVLLYKEHLYSFLKPWLGDGLLTSSGNRWLQHQKLYAPAFERPAIEGYLKVVDKTSDKMVRKLQQLAEDEWYFDVQEYVLRCTLDIVCKTATGNDSNSLDGRPSDLHKAIKDLCNVIQERTFSIVKRFDTLFLMTPYYWKQRSALQVLKREINWIIERRRQVLKSQKARRASSLPAETPANGAGSAEASETLPLETQPFLDVLLKAKLDGGPLRNRDIFEELSTFIFTGHEPLASAISFTLFTLSRHPQIQQQVYEEQQRIFSSCLRPGNEHKLMCNEFEVGEAGCLWENLEQMQYLEQVIRETLRLYPSVPLIARTNRKPIDINGMKIARRTTVIMCLIAMGYNEKYFDEPCEFRPERFAKQTPDKQNLGIEAFKSVPFSAGPRQCIAEKYAMLQLKAVISKIIRNFELLPPREDLRSGINDHSQPDCVPQSDFDPILNIRITLKSENGILLRLRKRSAAL